MDRYWAATGIEDRVEKTFKEISENLLMEMSAKANLHRTEEERIIFFLLSSSCLTEPYQAPN